MPDHLQQHRLENLEFKNRLKVFGDWLKGEQACFHVAASGRIEYLSNDHTAERCKDLFQDVAIPGIDLSRPVTCKIIRVLGPGSARLPLNAEIGVLVPVSVILGEPSVGGKPLRPGCVTYMTRRVKIFAALYCVVILQNERSPPASSETARPDSPGLAVYRDAETLRAKSAYWLTALLISHTFIAMDETVQTTATVKIGNAFNALDRTSWLGTAWFTGVVVAYMFWTTAGEIWGRKSSLVGYHAVYLFGILLSGFANSIAMVFVGRAFQGLGCGGSVSLMTIVIADTFIYKNKRAYYEAIRTIIYAVASMIGPTIGGVLSDRAGWRWIYRFQIPGVFFAGIIVLFFFPDVRTHQTGEPPWQQLRERNLVGMACVAGGTILLYVGFDQGSNFSWGHPAAYISIIVSVVLYALFAVTEYSHPNPFLSRMVLKNRSMLMSILINFTSFTSSLSSAYYVPVLYQAVRKTSSTTTGLLLIPAFAGVTFILGAAHLGMDRLGGVKRWLVVACTLSTISALAYALVTQFDPLQVYGQSVIIFFWFSAMQCIVWASVMSMNAHLYSIQDSSPAFRSLFLFRGLGTGLGISVYSVIVQSTLSTKIAQLQPPVSKILAYNLRQSLEYVEELDLSRQDTVRRDYSIAIANAFYFGVVTLFCCIPMALATKSISLLAYETSSKEDDSIQLANLRAEGPGEDIHETA